MNTSHQIKQWFREYVSKLGKRQQKVAKGTSTATKLMLINGISWHYDLKHHKYPDVVELERNGIKTQISADVFFSWLGHSQAVIAMDRAERKAKEK